MKQQNEHKITLQTNTEILAVCRLEPRKELPTWINFETTEFVSITQTKDEFSIVCNQNWVPDGIKAEKNWRVLKIKGQLDFSLVGILKRVITPLSDNGISIYTISTYDTDYILVQGDQFERAIELLAKQFEIEQI